MNNAPVKVKMTTAIRWAGWLLAVTSIAILGVYTVAYAADAARFEGEGMAESSTAIAVVSDANASGGQTLRFVENGNSASRAITFSQNADRVALRVRGADTTGTATLPQARVFIDGTDFSTDLLLNQTVSGSYQTLRAPINEAQGNHTVRVRMGNRDTGDRIFVDWVAFTGPDAPPPADADGDGVADASDNCPNNANTDQADLDSDGIGNVCDSDRDGDGRPNDTDYAPDDPNVQDPPATPAFNPGYGKGSTSECTTTISPGASIETSANNLSPGGVLCLRGGVYDDDNRITISTSGTSSAIKKVKGYPGERPEIRASLYVNNAARSNWEFEGLFIDASYSPVGTGSNNRINTDQAISWDDGTNLTFDALELVNRRPSLDPDLAGTCVHFGAGSLKPSGIVIENSWIHQCGQLPRDNLEHCVYAGENSSMTIRDTRLTDCANRAIQLYTDSDNANITGNLIDSDHNIGVLVGGDTSNSTITHNVIDTPNGNTITLLDTSGNPFTGSGNSSSDNCVWDTAQRTGTGLSSTNGIVRNPQISGYTVTDATCAAKLPTGSSFR